MERLSSVLISLMISLQLAACAAVSIQAQKAPGLALDKTTPIYLERTGSAPIAHQKYLGALESVLREEGFNLSPTRKLAKYVMRVGFNDFSSTVTYSSPDVKTTVVNGYVGSTPVGGTATTIGSKQSQMAVPTHNSRITVIDKTSGNPIWEASMAKSYDVYGHDELKKMIAGMLSLYGKDGRATEIVGDDLRW